MAQGNDATVEEQIAEYSRETHDEYLGEYLDLYGRPVHIEDDLLVFADDNGHELNEWADDIGVERSDVAEWMHDRADDADYSWISSDPIVLLKPDDDVSADGGVIRGP